MRYKSSTFYANFSLAESVKKNNSRSGAICFGGGMGGGGVASGHYSTGSKEARYHKTDSFSCRLGSAGRSGFGAAELMRALKADVEKDISNSGANVVDSGDTPSGFYLKYTDEGIQGHIEVTGDFSGAGYFGLNATLSETSTSEKRPLVEERKNVRRPAGDYHVVALVRDDPRAATQEFYESGRRALSECRERIRQKLLAGYPTHDPVLPDLEYAEVYVWTPISPETKERWEEAMGEELAVPSEYDQYGKVYFLNEVAFRMYREAGVDLEVLKTIPADEVAKIPGPSLRGPYISRGT